MLAAFLCAAASGDLVSVRKDCQAWHKAPEIVHSDMNYKAFIAELTGKLQRAPMVTDEDVMGAGYNDEGVDVFALHISLPCVHNDTGLWLEFGAEDGTSARILSAYRQAQRPQGDGRVYGFDDAGSGPRPSSTPLVSWIPGPCNATLRAFLLAHPPPVPVRLVHLQLATHVPTAGLIEVGTHAPRLAERRNEVVDRVLLELAPRLEPGTVLVLHRLINYEDFREGEMFALYELMRARPDLAVEILGTSTKMIITDVAMLRGHPNRPGKGSFGLPQAAALRFITLTPQLKSVPLHGLTQG